MKFRTTLLVTTLVCWAIMAVAFASMIWAAPQALTFDCTPAVDAITSAKIQFNALPPVDAPLVSTCGSGDTKITCTDPASKTICFPDTLWPTPGSFTAKAMVSNIRDSSAYSLPLNVPGVPSSPSLLRAIPQ